MAARAIESTLEPPRVAIPHGVMRDGALIRELRLTPVAGDDQASLLDSTASTSNERANLLLERCLDEDDATTLVSSLVAGDREALLLHLRRLTLGETLDCVLTCPAPECGERMELELRVDDLLVEGYGEVQATYEIAMDARDAADPPIVVRFRLPTVADLRAATAMSSGDPEAVAADLLARCSFGEVDGSEGIAADEIDAGAREPIAAAMAERDPQAEIELDLVCPSCGTPFGVVFDTATFLLQELDARAARLLEEVHALAFHYHWSEREILAMAPTRRERYLTLLADALRGSDAAGYAAR
jgi:hypothetical protein